MAKIPVSKKNAIKFVNQPEFKELLETGKLFIAGSYRRDLVMLGDIDFITTLSIEDFEKIIRSIRGFKDFEVWTIRKGKKIASYSIVYTDFDTEVRFQLDVKTSVKEEIPFMLMGFTGSMNMNIVLRNRAKVKGFILNDYGIYHISTKERVQADLRSEGDIFNFLGYEYIPTNMRSANSVAEGFTILNEFKIKE